MQIDWITGEVSSPEMVAALGASGSRLYDTGRMLVMGPGGEVREEWAGSELVPSHDTNLRVKSPDGFALWLSGNPVKWFQGHNLFGSTNLLGLFLAAGVQVRERVGLFPGPATFKANDYTHPRFTRLDVTRSYRFPSDAHARAWLRDVAGNARSRHGAPVLKGTTVTWGKGSSHWSLKAYLKSQEIQARGKGHRLPHSFGPEKIRLLHDWAQGVVRFEVCLRRRELQGLVSIGTGRTLWQNYFDRITFNRNTGGLDMLTATLPNHLQGYLARWERGEDLRAALAKPTFYRTRGAILKATGIDIAAPPPERQNADPVAGELDPKGWDPEPIEEFLYEPGDDLAKQYGLV